jgi:micrococcal nuclease
VETIRLIGFDTPESVRPGTPIECGAGEAKANMLRLAFGDNARDTDDDRLADEDAADPANDGALVTIKTDSTQDRRDRYGRLLAYVSGSHTGIDVAQRQLAAGWAKVYVFDRPFQRVAGYRSASSAARQAGRGGWSTCDGDFHEALS